MPPMAAAPVVDKKETYVRGVTDIVQGLIKAFDSKSPISLTKLKKDVARKYKLSTTPKMVDIIAAVPEDYRAKLQPYLKSKPIRSASGIAVVAVMCKPHRCPHIDFTGNVCVYCPGGPDSDFEYSTQAYTGYEPTSMRAIRSRYNPYLQTRDRVEQLKQLGHSVDKIEFIVMGGTFLSMDPSYRDYFIRSLHDALSGHSSTSVAEAIQYSEQSNSKCIGITIETRPDYCLKPHLNSMLTYGCTRIEIGVQSIYEDVARDSNRGHTIAAVSHSFQLAKDCGFKVVSHLMPDLPNMGWERDLEGFTEFFENPAFRPDGLKLYPTLVIRGTGLYELWKTGAYKNYPPETLVDLVARMLALVPPWTRVYRIQRDIPMPLVTSGVEHGNLRELALARMRDLGLACRDVRTREVGIRDIHHRVRPDQVELLRRDYCANGGWETFLSYEDPQQDILVGLLRLRKCSAASFRPELVLPKMSVQTTSNKSTTPAATVSKTKIAALSKSAALKRLPGKHKAKGSTTLTSGTSSMSAGNENNKTNSSETAVQHATHTVPKEKSFNPSNFDAKPAPRERGLGGVSIVRELHVYGTAIPVHSRDPTKFQHQGFGTLLMEEAERIAREEHGSDKIAVISGVGTRHYYRKLGYELDGPYMSKMLI